MEISINITLPTSWQELTDDQLRFAYGLIAAQLTEAEVKAHCLLKWAGLKVVGRLSDGRCVLKQKSTRIVFPISKAQLANLLLCLAWLDEPPSRPVRLSRIGLLGRYRAVDAELRGVPFEGFLYCDNLYQGYLHTQSNELLRDMAAVLYGAPHIRLDAAERVSVFYWFAAVKSLFARTFSHFLQPAGTGGNMLRGSLAQQLTEAMNAQLRALTKGDITKEAAVRQLDTWRALYELDALAKEAEELKNIK